MKTITAFLIIGISAIFSFNELSGQPNATKVSEEMKKFGWMTGDWKGEAWYLGRDQKKVQIIQKEHIINRLDGTIIIMEGTGMDIPSRSEEAKIIFQALGIFTFDLNKSKFVLRAYQGGNFTDSEMTPNPDGSFSWGIEMPNGNTRYTIRLLQEGKWNEVGEFSQDGKTWNKTFEMTLSKQ
jgi:hypothetical protein